jgi:hypothetical protein
VYGRVPEFERVVLVHGLSRVEEIKFPSPHAHH